VCATEGQPEGTIVSNQLEGVLGVVKKGEIPAKTKLGVDMFAEGSPPPHEGTFAEFVCTGSAGPQKVVVKGSVIHEVKTNAMILSTTENFVALGGVQKIRSMEGQGEDVLLSSIPGFAGGQFVGIGLQAPTILKNEERIEANSVV
jgi:hypothetical protein